MRCRPDRRAAFVTLPSAEAHREPTHNPRGLFNFRFQFGSCANQNPKSGIGPSLPTYATMQRELPGKALFSIMNGDFIYEEHRSMPVADWLGGSRPGRRADAATS